MSWKASCSGRPRREHFTAGYVVLRLPLEIKDLFREWLAANVPGPRGAGDVARPPDARAERTTTPSGASA